MEFKRSNSGLLSTEMVKTGDRMTILEPAFSIEKNGMTYWNMKVEMQDGTHKLASPMESCCELFAKAWGGFTEKWVGHIIEVEIRMSKAGTPYMWLFPANLGVKSEMDIASDANDVDTANHATNASQSSTGGVTYPTEKINAKDIPF